MAIVPRELNPGELPVTVARPVDSYDRPQMESGRSGLGEFLSALGKLEPNVTQLMKTIDKKQGDEAENAANLQAISADPKALRSEIESGNYFGMAHRRARNALSVLDAQNRAFEIGADLDAKQQRGELRGADGNQVFAQVVQPQASAITNPMAAKAFNQVIQPTLRKFQLGQTQEEIKSDMADKEGQLFRYITNLNGQIERDGGTPEDHRQALYKVADFAKNNLLLGPEQTEKVLARAAQQYAMGGKKGLVEIIGDYDRNGARLRDRYGPTFDQWTKTAEATGDRTQKEGTQKLADGLGARLLKGEDKPEDFNRAVDDLHKADPDNFGATRAEQMKGQFAQQQKTRADRQAKLLTDQHKGRVENEYVDAGANALIDKRGYSLEEEVNFKTPDGKDNKLNRKDYERRMFEAAERKIEERGKAEGKTAEAIESEKTQVYGANGSVRPVIQRSFNDLYAGSKAGAPPQGVELDQRLAHLEHLRTADPGQYIAIGGTDKPKSTWLQAYAAARDSGAEPSRAYATANQRVFQGGALERLSPSERNDALEKITKKFAGEGVLGGLDGREKATRALDLAIAGGWPTDKLPEKALEILKQGHVIVNGVAVRNGIPGVGNPQVVTEYMKDAADFFKRENPSLKGKSFKVALADDPARPGHYIFRRTDTMESLTKPGQSVTGEQLKDYVMKWREADSKTAEQERSNLQAIQVPDSQFQTGA